MSELDLHNLEVLSRSSTSLNLRRSILPDKLRGMPPMNLTPPRSCLCKASLLRTYAFTSSSVMGLRPSLRTTNARGISLPGMRGSGIPTTPASRISSCPRRTASISAGATCKPLYLINSCGQVSRQLRLIASNTR